ncbi:hypothetical protein [Rhizobium binxianense]
MADLVKEFVTGVVDSVLQEVLKKTTGRTTTKRRRRQTRTASPLDEFLSKAAASLRKPAKKQVSKRRTAASRSRQRIA